MDRCSLTPLVAHDCDMKPRALDAGSHGKGTRQHGFTLIELLVVVSIIALLISILLPSLKSARDQAKVVRCLGNQHGMGQAAGVWAAERKSLFQIVSSQTGTVSADPSKNVYSYDALGEVYSWPTALAIASGATGFDANWRWGVRADSYAAATAIKDRIKPTFEPAICPSDQIEIATPYYPRGDQLIGVGDPSFPQSGGGSMSYWGKLSYGINEDIVGNEVPDISGYTNPGCWKDGCYGELQSCAGFRLRGNLDRVFDPGTCMLFIDAGPDTSEEAAALDGFANLIPSAQVAGPLLEDFMANLEYKDRISASRHSKGRLSVTFADFHGATVKPTEFWTSGSANGLPKKFSSIVRISPYRPYDTTP